MGFGICKKEHIEALEGHAEIAVIGSAITNLIENKKESVYLKDIEGFIKGLMS